MELELYRVLGARDRERFRRKHVVNMETGCWEWLGKPDPDGYGVFRMPDRTLRAHRVSYWIHVGPIPAGLPVIDHLCNVPCCVNPEHLSPATAVGNVMRGDSPHAIAARRTHCLRGHEFTPETYLPRVGCLICRRAADAQRKRELRG